MTIKVFDCEAEEEIYRGDAEDFLYDNDDDEELAELLGMLNNSLVGASTSYFGHCANEYIITKIHSDVMYD